MAEGMNSHAAAADQNVEALRRAYGGGVPEALVPGVATAQAALALAYEQRTANLIALYSVGSRLTPEQRAAIGDQIMERLGIR